MQRFAFIKTIDSFYCVHTLLCWLTRLFWCLYLTKWITAETEQFKWMEKDIGQVNFTPVGVTSTMERDSTCSQTAKRSRDKRTVERK